METTPPMVAAARPRLCDADAWAIAMTWQAQLQGKVRLVVDTDGPVDSIIKSYAWVQLDEPCMRQIGVSQEDCHEQRLAVMHAVVVSWAALAACPGYSGSENGVFWKRVISELQQDREQRSPYDTRRFAADTPFFVRPGVGRVRPTAVDTMVTDAHGFFDQAGHAFPRFKLDTSSIPCRDLTRVFTSDASALPAEVSTQLASVLTHLQTYQVNEPPQSIEVCLQVPFEPYPKAESRALSDLVRRVNDSTACPPFRISKFDIDGVVQLASAEPFAGFVDLVRTTPLPIGPFTLDPLWNKATRETTAQWIHAFLRMDGHIVEADVTSLAFLRRNADATVFQALLSALPFARSTHSIQH